MTLGFARLSAILFFRRIFCTGTWSTFDIITKVLIGIVSSWMVCFFFMTVFICGSNLAILWSFKNIETCLVFQVQKGVAVSSFILDFIILVLPLPKVCRCIHCARWFVDLCNRYGSYIQRLRERSPYLQCFLWHYRKLPSYPIVLNGC